MKTESPTELTNTDNSGIEAMKRASLIAAERGISDMTLDEINAEVAAARQKVYYSK